MNKIWIPQNYDYVGVYLTDKCHLRCPYCITRHHDAVFGSYKMSYLTSAEWVTGLNRLVLPADVPISFQGGEPFLYPGIWDILDRIEHKVDIMTALPGFLTKAHFQRLKTLDWNKREAPYPTVRVSYHKGQNDYRELVDRIADLQDILSIGLYYLEHPENTPEELAAVKAYAEQRGVELRSKEFLGVYQGKTYGTFRFPDAAVGRALGMKVWCRNTVVPIAPDGLIYLCHSDLYFNRRGRSLGHVLDGEFVFPQGYTQCEAYGLCSECDIKVKTNHYQQYGYTSVDIKFNDPCSDGQGEVIHELEKA